MRTSLHFSAQECGSLSAASPSTHETELCIICGMDLSNLAEAALEIFDSEEHDPLADVSVRAVSKRAGVSERAVFAQLNRERLRQLLVSHLLDSPKNRTAPWDRVDEAARIEQLLCDRTRDLSEALSLLANGYIEQNLTDSSWLGAVSLLPSARFDSDLAFKIESMLTMYDRDVRTALNAFVVDHSDVLAHRQWLNVDHAAMLSVIVIEGLSMRTLLHRSQGGTGFPFDAELPGRALESILASLVMPHGEVGASLLEDLDDARRLAPQG